MTGATRRRVLIGCAGLVTSLMLPAEAKAVDRVPFPDLRGLPERALRLGNRATGEVMDARYWREGRYDLDMLRKIAWFLRDPHTGTARSIDRSLLDLLCSIQRATASPERLTILSAYRSARTNAALVAAGQGAAPNSYHMSGRAVDVCIEGVSAKRLRDLARRKQIGGVGYYPRHGFVHLDTGPVRLWLG